MEIQNLVQKTGFTDSLNYQLKSAGVGSSSKRMMCQSLSPDYTGSSSSTIRIRIPCGQYGTYLDGSQSYLMFDVVNTTADPGVDIGGAPIETPIVLDGHCSSVFRRFEVYANGGNDRIEDIQEYNALYSMFLDLQTNYVDRVCYLNLLQGCDQNRTGVSISRGEKRTFCMPLISGLLNGDKYVPLGKMQNDLEIRIQLEDGIRAFVGANNDYQLENVQYVAQIIELDAVAEQSLPSDNNMYVWGGESFSNHNDIINEYVGSASIYLPFKYGSLKTVWLIHRNDTNFTNTEYRAITGRSKANLDQYQFAIGSQMVPPNPVRTTNGTSEVAMEVFRALHSVNLPSGGILTNGIFSKENTTTENGAFVLAQELESFSRKNDVLQSGTNTIGSTCYYKGTYNSVPDQMRVDAWAHFDTIYIVSEGQLQMQV